MTAQVAIPTLAEAEQEFRSFLARQGHPSQLAWVFRDDVWQVSYSTLLVRWPVPARNGELVQKLFAEGRLRGLVELHAVGLIGSTVLATAWYPKFDEDEVQGWNTGMKLSIKTPLTAGTRVPTAVWPAFHWLPAFRRFQTSRLFLPIGTRKWAAA